jgi:nucleoside-diphosphate-sugar epimerase
MLFLEQNLFNNEIYNVITGNFTVETVINNIQEFVPDLEMSFVDAPAMNPSLCIDDTKIRALGFRPTEDLRAGIAETIACLKQRKQQNI